jgi:hypothetical protein
MPGPHDAPHDGRPHGGLNHGLHDGPHHGPLTARWPRRRFCAAALAAPLAGGVSGAGAGAPVGSSFGASSARPWAGAAGPGTATGPAGTGGTRPGGPEAQRLASGHYLVAGWVLTRDDLAALGLRTA